MSIQIKIQVLAITPSEKRTYAGRSWFQRQFQCIAEQKVFVYTQNASADENEAGLVERQKLDSFKEGFYMADLALEQGDRAKPVFAIRNMTPVKQGAPV